MTTAQAFALALEHHRAGQLAKAEALYRQILAAEPNHASAHSHLGEVCRLAGRLDEAIASYRRALELKPEFPEAHNNLGIALRWQGRLDEADVALRRALELRPGFAEACNNLGNVLRDGGQLGEAVAAYRRALELKPDYREAHNNLGNTLNDQGRLDEAVAVFRRALELQPGFPEAHNNLGIVLKDQGQLDEAVAAFRRAIELKPDYPEAHGNLIYALHFHPDHDDRTIAAEHHRWNRQFAEPLKRFILPQTNDRTPARRLRVGYVSPDFRFQAEAFFVVPLLEAHDHQNFEIHCYSSVIRPDDVTARLRRSADVWHDVRGRSDHDLAQQVRADGIDILVDLTMHMAGNRRLLVFARKPAPIQVTWLAYPGSTGLETMDYRLTDRYLDPPTVEPPCYSEKSVSLPDCWCCYHPLTDEPSVQPPPGVAAPGVTFGCLNNFCKINDPTLALFAKVLGAVEGSRLILLAPEGSARGRLLDRLQEHGDFRHRVEFVGKTSRHDYLKHYHRIDIALDPLPYNGITTTCDALWMGVPVVSLAGKTAAGRAGLSILSTVGLPELATRTPEEFVQAAERLAWDRPGLARLRAALRSQMHGSALMDAPRFARNVEAAYRTLWHRWCAENSSSPQ